MFKTQIRIHTYILDMYAYNVLSIKIKSNVDNAQIVYTNITIFFFEKCLTNCATKSKSLFVISPDPHNIGHMVNVCFKLIKVSTSFIVEITP